jgi:hypothetical protein
MYQLQSFGRGLMLQVTSKKQIEDLLAKEEDKIEKSKRHGKEWSSPI